MYICNNNQNRLERIGIILLATLIEFLASNVLIYLIAFTFGAYLIENVYENLVFSIFMSMVCVMPSFLYCEHKNALELVDRLFFKNGYQNRIEERLVTISYGAIIGAWFGALVIPLDWDRWWQEWPICSIFGSILGIFLAIVYDYIKTSKHFKNFMANKTK